MSLVLGTLAYVSQCSDPILIAFNEARSSLPAERSAAITAFRNDLDSAILHVSRTPVGLKLFGVMITVDLVKTAVGLFFSVLSIVFPKLLIDG